MSGDRSSPRFEIVASTRRSWSREQKSAIVAEIGVGDATLSEVARRHGIHTSLLFRWRREFELAVADVEHRAPLPRPALSFVPVTLPPVTLPPVALPPSALPPPTFSPPDLSSPRAPAPPSKAGRIDVVLSGGRTVRVDSDVDTTALLRIVAALEGKS